MDSIYLHCDPTASHYLKIMMERFLALIISEMILFGNEAILTTMQKINFRPNLVET